MFDFYNIEISKIFKQSEQEMFNLHHPYVGTEHLLLSLLKLSSEVNMIALDYGLTYESFKNELINVVGSSTKKSSYVLYTPLLKRVIKNATVKAMHNNQELSAKSLFMALLDEGEGIAIRVLIGMDIDIDELYEELKDHKSGSGTKLELLEVGKNLSELVDMDDILVGRDKELTYIIETLIRKDKNNPLLIGPAGVGKTAIVEELARRINKGEVPSKLKNKKIVLLEMGALVAGTKYRGEFEERLTKIIKELEKCDEYIIFIDEIHSMVNAGGAEGAINAADILKPYLARGAIKCIGATTTYEYNKFIASDKALARRFETINIVEPDIEETKNILRKVKKTYEKHYNIKIKDLDLEKIVDLATKYIYTQKNPDKALDVLDSVCAFVCMQKEQNNNIKNYETKLSNLAKQKEELIKANDFEEAIKIYAESSKIQNKLQLINNKKIQSIREDDIYYVISKKINIPLPKEKEGYLEKLNNELNNLVYGQEEAIKDILITLKNKYFINDTPISFIFNGPSGVGKTYISKIMAKVLKMPILKLDFSDYSSSASLSKLLGSTAGYVGYDDGALLNQFKYQPYSLLIIENYDGGCLEVKKLLDQILEEGLITNAKGEDISFRNSLIIINSRIQKENNVGFNQMNVIKDAEFLKLSERVSKVVMFNNLNDTIVTKYFTDNNYDKAMISKIKYQNGGFKTIIKALKNFNLEHEKTSV